MPPDRSCRESRPTAATSRSSRKRSPANSRLCSTARPSLARRAGCSLLGDRGTGEPVDRQRQVTAYHAPVLVAEVTAFLRDAKRVLDGTLGGGGHTLALLDAGVPEVIGL